MGYDSCQVLCLMLDDKLYTLLLFSLFESVSIFCSLREQVILLRKREIHMFASGFLGALTLINCRI